MFAWDIIMAKLIKKSNGVGTAYKEVAEEDVPLPRLYGRAGGVPLRFPDGCLPLRPAAARRNGIRTRPPRNAHHGLTEHSGRHRLPEGTKRFLPDDGSAGLCGR